MASFQQLQRQRATLLAETKSKGKATSSTRFQYAMLAVSSVRTHDVRDGVNVLQTLLEEEGPKRDYLYFIAQGHYALGEYPNAKLYLQQLIAQEPGNGQAKALMADITAKEQKDTFSGAALVAAGVLGAVASMMAARRLLR
eukprot:m.23991 g.23991  ORF g.23991 m.23991 type:complete len:141 (+) comp11460_c0_seq1:223-645(+)